MTLMMFPSFSLSALVYDEDMIPWARMVLSEPSLSRQEGPGRGAPLCGSDAAIPFDEEATAGRVLG